MNENSWVVPRGDAEASDCITSRQTRRHYEFKLWCAHLNMSRECCLSIVCRALLVCAMALAKAQVSMIHRPIRCP